MQRLLGHNILKIIFYELLSVLNVSTQFKYNLYMTKKGYLPNGVGAPLSCELLSL